MFNERNWRLIAKKIVFSMKARLNLITHIPDNETDVEKSY